MSRRTKRRSCPIPKRPNWTALSRWKVFPGRSRLTASVGPVGVAIQPGTLQLSAAEATFELADILTVSASSEFDTDGTLVEPGISLTIDPFNIDPAATIATINNLNFAIPALPDVPLELLTIDSIGIRGNGFDIVDSTTLPGTTTIGSNPALLSVDDLQVDLDLHVSFVAPTGSVIPRVFFSDDSGVRVRAGEATLLPGSDIIATISDDPAELEPDPLNDDSLALDGQLDLNDGTLNVIVDRLTGQVANFGGLDVRQRDPLAEC